jgi:predicted transcriptional regulator
MRWGGSLGLPLLVNTEVNLVTGEQKQKIQTLRQRGLEYGEIGDILGIAKNTVKTYCWRNNLSKNEASEETKYKENKEICKHCGKSLEGASKTKPRKFCCDRCRFAWWRQHRDQLNRTAICSVSCAYCGKEFDSYGNRSRRYCCHAHYIAHRYPGERQVAAT